MSGSHIMTSPMLSLLRQNYMLVKTQYFDFLHTYKQDFWSNLYSKYTQYYFKFCVRFLLKINKPFIKNKLSQIHSTIKVQEKQIIQPTQTKQEHIYTLPVSTNTSEKTYTHVQVTNLINNIIMPYIEYLKSITTGKWCKFKKTIADIYISLVTELNQLTDHTFNLIKTKATTKIINILDLYKNDTSDSYKDLFNLDSTIFTIFIKTPQDHPLIKVILSLFINIDKRHHYSNLFNERITI